MRPLFVAYCAQHRRSTLSIFIRDDANVVHVFSVVREFESKIYEKLLKRERAIERNLSQVSFEFHVRAHQGREPAQAVPFKAELVYAQ